MVQVNLRSKKARNIRQVQESSKRPTSSPSLVGYRVSWSCVTHSDTDRHTEHANSCISRSYSWESVLYFRIVLRINSAGELECIVYRIPWMLCMLCMHPPWNFLYIMVGVSPPEQLPKWYRHFFSIFLAILKGLGPTWSIWSNHNVKQNMLNK